MALGTSLDWAALPGPGAIAGVLQVTVRIGLRSAPKQFLQFGNDGNATAFTIPSPGSAYIALSYEVTALYCLLYCTA